MKILITGGGTEVDIDSVRSIKNFSKGTTASLIAKCFLEHGHNVTYLVSESGKTPFQYTIDCYKNRNYTYLDYVPNFINWCNKYKDFYIEERYRTYKEYSDLLLEAYKQTQYDAIILAAAVSDFGVKKQEGKNSNLESLQFEKLDKVISKVKQYQPDTFLVGFKLLCNASDIELAVASYTSIINNGCDMVIANNLDEVGKRVVCFFQDLETADSKSINDDIADFIVNQILGRINAI